MFAPPTNQMTTRSRLASRKAQITLQSKKLQSVDQNAPLAAVVEKKKMVKKRAALGDDKEKKQPLKKVEEKKPKEVQVRKTRSVRKAIEKSDIPVFSAPPQVQEEPKVKEDKPEEVAHKRIKTQEWDDLDSKDIDDPTQASEYVVEIFEYMKKLEVDTLPNPNYITEVQKDISWKMRTILVDWLIDVHGKFRLLPETLYLTINIVDRLLSLRVVTIAKLQLVGVTAMFIAAKYEEIIAPSIQNYLQIVDGYTDDEILKAERYVLQVLNFGLSYPSPMSFLRRCSKAENYDTQTRTLAKYLMEISIIDHRFLPYVPSLVAGSALYLARKMLSRGSWDANLIHYSSYEEKEMIPCVNLMLLYLSGHQKYEALYKKYSAKKFMKAAIFAKDWIDRNHGTLMMADKLVGVTHDSEDGPSEYQEYDQGQI